MSIILDSYNPAEVDEIVHALDTLCSSSAGRGWSPGGVYIFWDIKSSNILYIGLANNLSRRFREHNGLRSASSTGCKYKEITEYFTWRERIGFTIVVQSPVLENVLEPIKIGEGVLLHQHKQLYGVLPQWNKVGGSVAAQQFDLPLQEMDDYFDVVTNVIDSGMVARVTLREIEAANPAFERYEEYLHAIRIRWSVTARSNIRVSFMQMFHEAAEDYLGTKQEIIRTKYLERKVQIYGPPPGLTPLNLQFGV